MAKHERQARRSAGSELSDLTESAPVRIEVDGL